MTAPKLQALVSQLAPGGLSKFAAWFSKYHNGAWDKQITDDLDAGRLDKWRAEVDVEIEAGLAKPFPFKEAITAAENNPA